MKNKLTILAAMLCLFALNMNAQSHAKGNILISADIDPENAGDVYVGTVEYGLTDDIGIGAGIAYISFSGASSSTFSGRAAYHLNKLINVNKFDFFGAAEVTLNHGNTFSLIPGARYYFIDNLALHAEYPIAINNGGGSGFKVGVTFKI